MFTRHNSWEHLKKCCKAISKGMPIPQMDRKAKEFNHKVAFMEAITEAPLQLCLSLLVVREYGISAVPGTKILQLTSLLTSSFSICLAYVMVRMTCVFKFLVYSVNLAPIIFTEARLCDKHETSNI